MTSSRGWLLIGIGGAIGFCFAALALCLSIVSFPLLLDRDVGLVAAVGASLRTAWTNPIAVALWGLIVATLLVLGSLPLFIGLAIVMPVLGHATWHFYRRAIVRDSAHEHPAQWPRESLRRPDSFYTSPHSVLFPWPTAEEKKAPRRNETTASSPRSDLEGRWRQTCARLAFPTFGNPIPWPPNPSAASPFPASPTCPRTSASAS